MSKLIIPRKKVSKAYYGFFDRFHRYEILLGGRGGSKSTHIAIKLLARAAVGEYFHCMYVRKVGDTIRDSQFKLFKDVIKYMGWQDEFKVNVSNYSITCIRNGNSFTAKGLDKADKTKSIAEPTHIWVEEADQITFDDFDTLNKSLRSPKTQNSIILSFNTFINQDHWIRQTLFDKDQEYELSEQFSDAFKLHTTYLDNDFIDHEEYRRTLTIQSGGNRHKIESDLNGTWGIEPNDSPWLYAFEPEKHISKLAAFKPDHPIYISFDFNNSPFEATVWQFSPSLTNQYSFIHCIDEFSGAFKIDEMCQRIKTKYPKSIMFVTGDRSGSNEDIGRNQTAYQLIQQHLRLSNKQLQLNTYNLEHSDSRILCNMLFANYDKIRISPDCKKLIRQCEIAKVDVKSSKPHHLLKDRGIYAMDAFDSMRYAFQTWFHDFVKQAYIQKK